MPLNKLCSSHRVSGLIIALSVLAVTFSCRALASEQRYRIKFEWLIHRSRIEAIRERLLEVERILASLPQSETAEVFIGCPDQRGWADILSGKSAWKPEAVVPEPANHGSGAGAGSSGSGGSGVSSLGERGQLLT